MRDLDDTDREILRLLLEDARRPYSDIADAVDLSPPAVSDRVSRLRETGLIRRFTLDLDRSLLRESVPVLVELSLRPDAAATDVTDGLGGAEAVEHVFRTAGGTVVCTATVDPDGVGSLLADHVDLAAVREYDVHLLADREWHPRIGEAELAPACAECGNTVTSEGESVRLDDEVYQFCCVNCRDQFVERYEELREGA